jgi:hypothetical protein
MNNMFRGNPSRVWSHGKWIEVEYLDDDPPKAKRRRPKRKPFVVEWVKLPDYWIEQLERARNIATFRLAHCILREAFKRQHVGGEIALSAAVTGLPSSPCHPRVDRVRAHPHPTGRQWSRNRH